MNWNIRFKKKTSSLQKELNERKRMVEWLRDSERRHHALLENVPDVIFLLDSNGQLTYVNLQAETFLDAPVKDILETSFKDHVVEEDRKRIDEILDLSSDLVWDGRVSES